MGESIDEEVDELYRDTPEHFVARRKALGARLKKAGLKSEAERIVALLKPSPSAWAVNRLYWEGGGGFETLFDVGRDLRAATARALSESSDPNAVVRVQRQQRAHVDALVECAKRELEREGLSASDAVLGRVRTTLTTLSTRGDWGESAAGRLAGDLDPLDMASLAGLLDVAPARDEHTGIGERDPARPQVSHQNDPPDARRADSDAAMAKAVTDREMARAAAEHAAQRVAEVSANAALLENHVREAEERQRVWTARVDELERDVANATRDYHRSARGGGCDAGTSERSAHVRSSQ
jgi:hypothetical protein